ncbi:MAG: phosphoglycolate phosphatase [Casimicrobiaceae bacterium]
MSADVKCVLFDLDGTLADSAPDLAAALNRVRAGEGLAAVAPATLRGHSSSGARGLLLAGMQVAQDHPRYPLLRDAFLAHYADVLADATRLFDGVDAMLGTLDARKIRWGVVTNKATRYTEPVMQALGLAQRAAVTVSGDTTAHPKPHPAPLLHAAQALAIDPAQCLYVGDDLRDIDAGCAAGMTSLVARWGYMGTGTDPDRWPAAGWLDAPGDLIGWMDAAAAAAHR